VYFALNKPKNVVTTNVGHRGDERRTIRELIPYDGHLFTIGRLDADSEGLVVLTNDGPLAQRLSHPRYEHTKTYKVIVYGLPNAETLEKWKSGVFLEEGKTAPAYVRIVKGANDFTTLRVVMTEGKKRQIRRVASSLGHPVRRLVRTQMGMLELGTLKSGEWRELSVDDVRALSTPAPELKAIKREGRRPAGREPQVRENGAERRSERRPARKSGGGVSEPSGDERRRPTRRSRTGEAPKSGTGRPARRSRPGGKPGTGAPRRRSNDQNGPRRQRGTNRRGRS
jgi:pseudouridine synthase